MSRIKNKLKHKKESEIKKVLSQKKEQKSPSEGKFKISFSHLDTTQKYSGSFEEWENEKLLANAFNTLQLFFDEPLRNQLITKKRTFNSYGDFPENSEFTHPENVPNDAEWARIHINGLNVIAGHIIENTFYIVFLDKEHKFYLTKRVRSNKN